MARRRPLSARVREKLDDERELRASVRSLVLVEQEPVRRRALDECRRAVAELEELKREWREYSERDEPAFQSWMYMTFGQLLSEIRETLLEVHEKRLFLQAVEDLAESRGMSYREAYRVVAERMEEKADPEDQHADSNEDFDNNTARNANEDADSNRAGGSSNEAPSTSAAAAAGVSGTSALKRLYRTLARKLHPDRGSAPGKQELELWHQVQNAYDCGDLEQLRKLAALADVQAERVGQGSTISEVLEAARSLRRSADILRADLMDAEEGPAWRFARGRSRKSLRKRMEKELQQELGEAQSVLHALEELIEGLTGFPGLEDEQDEEDDWGGR